MAKLLLYTIENDPSQCIMIVPDEWDEERAQSQAEMAMGHSVELEDTFDGITDEWFADSVGKYVAYVG